MSPRWQREATAPDDAFERYVAETRKRVDELTSGGRAKVWAKYALQIAVLVASGRLPLTHVAIRSFSCGALVVAL